MKELRKADAFVHDPSRPSLTDYAQNPLSKYQGVDGTIITRSSLTVTKLPCNTTCRIVRATAVPNQRNTIILEATVDHA